MTQTNLNPPNSRRAAALAIETRRSAQDLVNEAFDRFASQIEAEAEFDWKTAIMLGAGLWKGRDDLPDFDEIRRSMDRDVWSS